MRERFFFCPSFAVVTAANPPPPPLPHVSTYGTRDRSTLRRPSSCCLDGRQTYPKTLLLVSHDRQFLNEVRGSLIGRRMWLHTQICCCYVTDVTMYKYCMYWYRL